MNQKIDSGEGLISLLFLPVFVIKVEEERYGLERLKDRKEDRREKTHDVGQNL